MAFKVFSLVLVVLVLDEVFAQQDGTFFLKASKSVPRIGKRSRSNNNNDDNFEKFFLKASKSVPRIGRNSEFVMPKPKKTMNAQIPVWSDLPDLYEYNPELFSSPQLLEEYGMMGDDPSVNDWDRIRLKRTNIPSNYDGKELMEYRLQEK